MFHVQSSTELLYAINHFSFQYASHRSALPYMSLPFNQHTTTGFKFHNFQAQTLQITEVPIIGIGQLLVLLLIIGIGQIVGWYRPIVVYTIGSTSFYFYYQT